MNHIRRRDNPEDTVFWKALHHAIKDLKKNQVGFAAAQRREQRVYFIQAESGPVKIGIAALPAVRLEELQIAHHEQLTMLAHVAGGRKLESALHAEFSDDWIRGEWFRPSGQLLARISELTSDR